MKWNYLKTKQKLLRSFLGLGLNNVICKCTLKLKRHMTKFTKKWEICYESCTTFLDFFPFLDFLTSFATTSKAAILSDASLTSSTFICFSAFRSFSFVNAMTEGFAPDKKKWK